MTTLKRLCLSAISLLTLLAVLVTQPALARDPFRSTNPHSIPNQTAAGFVALFKDGNYPLASQDLRHPAPNDPLAFALRAFIAYLDGDLQGLKTNADQTVAAAQSLSIQDPLRSDIYLGVGTFLQGGYNYITSTNKITAAPDALLTLQQVLQYMNQAAALAPQDPELNLIKGYMDVFIALYLPFTSPEEAIDRLKRYGAPDYLVNRGLAIAYLNLHRYPAAMTAVDENLQETPDNPEIMYLKAQILAAQGEYQLALSFFDQALEKQAQLPTSIVQEIQSERNRDAAHIPQPSPLVTPPSSPPLPSPTPTVLASPSPTPSIMPLIPGPPTP